MIDEMRGYKVVRQHPTGVLTSAFAVVGHKSEGPMLGVTYSTEYFTEADEVLWSAGQPLLFYEDLMEAISFALPTMGYMQVFNCVAQNVLPETYNVYFGDFTKSRDEVLRMREKLLYGNGAVPYNHSVQRYCRHTRGAQRIKLIEQITDYSHIRK